MAHPILRVIKQIDAAVSVNCIEKTVFGEEVSCLQLKIYKQEVVENLHGENKKKTTVTGILQTKSNIFEFFLFEIKIFWHLFKKITSVTPCPKSLIFLYVM